MNIHILHQEDGRYTVTVGDKCVSNVIMVSVFGSHLHGTDGPDSDFDYKAIYMESLASILLGRAHETHVLSSGGETKNSKEDVDVEFIELRKFLKDAMKGQTYAVELLHSEMLLCSTGIFQYLKDNRKNLFTKHMQPFIGYCVAQAKKYGLKGEKLKDTEEILAYMRSFPPHVKLKEVLEDVPFGPHVFVVEKQLKNQDVAAKLLEVNGKQFNIEVPLKDVVPVIQNLVDSYGERAQRAREGVDWKAVSHAYRCIFELEELMVTGDLKFPLSSAARLKEVKCGHVSYGDVQDELPILIERVQGLDSVFPDNVDTDFWDQWTLKTYGVIQ